MTRSGRLAATLLSSVVCVWSVAAQDVSSALPRVAIEDSLSAPAIDPGPGLPVAVAVRVTGAVDDRALDERIGVYQSRKVPVWLALSAPASADAVERWRASLQMLVSRHRDVLVILEIDAADDPKVTAFALRAAATDARSTRDSIRVALGPPRDARGDWYSLQYTSDLTPYVDVLVLPSGASQAAAASHLGQVDRDARIALLAGSPGDQRDTAARAIIERQLETAGTNTSIVAWRLSDATLPALRALAPIKPLLGDDVTSLESSAANLAFSRGGQDVTASVRHRLLFDGKTFATYLVIWGEPSPSSLDLSVNLPVEGVPGVYRVADGTKLTASDYARNAETGRVRARIPLADGPVLVDFNEGAAEVFAERSDVSAARQLTVTEVIARHQQQQRTQDVLVRNYMASARTEQHFRPSMTDPGYDVVTENRYFVASDGIEWEEQSFSVNGSKWGSDRPPFPLLQPEKVLSLPLQLRFDNDYQYQLEGAERVGDYDCYVVRFQPSRTSTSLYRGTVWIDRKTFARIKVSAVQTGLSAPVVSNEEIQTYRPVTSIGNRPIFLFSGLTARQIILIAGRNILVEKMVAFDDFRVNDSSFEEARATARHSDAVMYKETDHGLRYYVKQGTERVVSDRPTTHAKAMAMGITLDPSYAFPLPILGINYLNFQFRGRQDTQLAILFAGVLAAGNIQRPKLGGTPFDASVDFFAIAAPSSDRLYDASGEREAERLLTWPLTTGLNLGWQYTPFQKLGVQYQFRFDGYVHDTTTAEDFQSPASTVTNGFGGAWEYRRGGYSAVVNGTWFHRAGWRDWGFETDAASKADYVKYSASLSRDFYFNVFHKIHLNGAWFSGRDLDRFSKYQFGMFDDTRIHGVPASGARFEELAMARGSYSFNIFDQYRLDLFLEQAWGRDLAFDPDWQAITGIGAAVNVRSFWGTILRVDAGKSFLPPRYRNIGSATLQVLFLKPMR
jgi:hypothetical protein